MPRAQGCVGSPTANTPVGGEAELSADRPSHVPSLAPARRVHQPSLPAQRQQVLTCPESIDSS